MWSLCTGFYLEYPIAQTLSAQFRTDSADSIRETPVFRLSWSHYLNLISIKNIEERRFYEIESIENNWSIRELKRQYDSGLYMRLALSTDKLGVERLSEKGQLMESPADAIKDPYILEVRHGTLYYILGSAKGLLKRMYPSQPIYLDLKGKGESSILVKRSLEIKYVNQSSARLELQPFIGGIYKAFF